MKIIGVDVGGTFTDFHILDTLSTRTTVFKVSSTPDNPALAIVDGLRELERQGVVALDDIRRLCHGTTVATNALIQRRGGRVALITTQGFRDLLEIGRQIRPHLYDLQTDQPEPLVPRERRLEAPERLLATGQVLRPLDAGAAQEIAAAVAAAGVDACAVCLLFAFLDPAHERTLAAALEARGIPVSLSSEVQPEFREYERMSTTVLNAYLTPVMVRYLQTLETSLQQLAPRAVVGINQSSGGLMSVRQARRFPVRTALSGPAGGVVGAAHVARLADRPDVITLDMGGTSADVCLIRDFEAGIAFDREVGGFPVRLPAVDVNAVGAGGGSIAWFDAGGFLKVGPTSAGAKPGPACYGIGGTQPTVTDANLLLGRLSARGLLDGRLPLGVDLARQAYLPVAERLGVSVEVAALGCIDIVVSNMVRAIRAVSVERGHDPRDFALMPFGGGGPLHAEAVARELGMDEVIVPPYPGILCAHGIVVSDLKENFVRTCRVRLEPSASPVLEASTRSLLEQAAAWFEAEEIPAADRRCELSLDLRYVGQNYELPVPVQAETLLASGDEAVLHALVSDFGAIHEKTYGHQDPAAPVEVVNLRCVARGVLQRPQQVAEATAATKSPEPCDHRLVWFDRSGPVQTPVFERSALQPGQEIAGPAIVQQMDTTTLLHPGSTARVDAAFNLLLRISA